jgi:inner membrane protein
MSLAHRRGWTHGVLAWLILPIALTGLLLAWDKWVRLKKWPDATPARALPLLGLSMLAVLSHPALDWLNNYGIRLLMPFDGRWFYGDALFILDPWVWLLAGGASFLMWSRNWPSLLGWVLIWSGTSGLVLTNGMVPDQSRWIWGLGLAALMLCRWVIPLSAIPRTAQISLVVMAIYMSGSAAASLRAEALVKERLAVDGYSKIEDVMVGPTPANPFNGQVVALVDDSYLFGSWSWLAGEKLTLSEHTIARNLADPISQAAAQDTLASRFLTWSRFPFAVIETVDDGYRVGFGDARYFDRDGGIRGPTVALDRQLRIISSH